ncbi:MAG: hydroxyacid dehydrogenase [Clostridia bacterium]|nr:hydroxyacid dehydrogenase [Clostridia bacterium]
MKITVLDAGSLGDDLSLAPLSEFGDVTVYRGTLPEEIAARVADCDVLLQNKVKITREVLSHAKKLRLICEAATGYDNIDLAAARERGIAVCNVPGYSAPSVAQVTVAMVLSLATHLPDFNRHVSSGTYSKGDAANYLVPVYRELAGKTWGVVGYGAIGSQVARVAEALGCRVLVCREHPKGEPNEVDIDTLCRESDVISLHTPLTEGTRGMIDARRLSMMRDGVILVNVARGAVTDEAAVAEALKSGKLGGLGVDVYSVEPFREDHPFYAIKDAPRVSFTPHMSWGAYESRVRCLNVICSNIKAFFEEKVQNRVDLL